VSQEREGKGTEWKGKMEERQHMVHKRNMGVQKS
jgi:hypothetical protein